MQEAVLPAAAWYFSFLSVIFGLRAKMTDKA